MHFYFIFLHFSFVTSFSTKLNFITLNIPISILLFSITFLITKITTLHQLFIYLFSKIQKKHYFSQIHTKYTFHSYFISFPTNCASRFFFTYNTSSLFYTSSFTTKNPPKKSQKNSFFTKIPNYPFLLPT